jgi:hypothetical protein
MPVIRNSEYKRRGLYSLRVKGDADFRKAAEKPFFRFEASVPVVTLDCYSKVQFESSQKQGTGVVTKNVEVFGPVHLAFLDYEKMYSELQQYKQEKARHNVHIMRNDLKELLQNTQWYKILIPQTEFMIHQFEDYERFERIAVALLKKYFDRLYYTKQNQWESQVVGYDLVTFDDDNENFLNEEKDEYAISIEESGENQTAIAWLRQVIEEVKVAKTENKLPSFSQSRSQDMEVLNVPMHLYNPLLYLAKGNVEIGISPVALNEDEVSFVKKLHTYVNNHEGFRNESELYLIRNRSKRGIGFFDGAGFYPDFILWLIINDRQYITFIDPHGMGRESISSPKVLLHRRLKSDIEPDLAVPSVSLTSFILSPTKYLELPDKSSTIEEWNNNHVLFMDDSDYIAKLFARITGK